MPIVASLIVGTLLAAAPDTALSQDVAAFPADTPASYRNECGGCHTAFPPGLLARGDWRTVMEGLPHHFGENAAIPEAAHREIEDFLVRNAGSARRFGSRSEPPRVSATTWFRRTHGTVRAAFKDPRVGSAANCDVCHHEAAVGRYERKAPLVRQLAREE